MSDAPVTYEEFAAVFDDASLSQLREMVEADDGPVLKAKTKPEALREAYSIYTAEAAAKDETPSDPPPPAKDPPSDPPATPTAEDFGAPAEAVVYEARSRTGRSFCKMGLVFGTSWQPIGAMSDDEIALLQKFKQFVQLRIRG